MVVTVAEGGHPNVITPCCSQCNIPSPNFIDTGSGSLCHSVHFMFDTIYIYTRIVIHTAFWFFLRNSTFIL